MEEPRFDALTKAERQVLRAALGRTNDQIGAALGISPNTAATHLLSARRKLGNVPKGDAARMFQVWEATQTPHQELTRPPLVMEPPPPLGNPNGAAGEKVNEVRDDFAIKPEPPTAQPRERHVDYRRPYERTVLILLAASLLLACFTYLPKLVTLAVAVGNFIDPPFPKR